MAALDIKAWLTSTALSFLFLLVAFIPMEKAFPAKKDQPLLRPQWRLDLCYFLGQYILWTGLVFWLLDHFEYWLDPLVPAALRSAVAQQPWALQAVEVVFFSDVLTYWGHRLQHRVDFLWQFHKVHHSAEHLDWLAAHREHPLDSLYTIGLINLPAFLMGFPLETLSGLAAFRGIWAIYIHSNVRLPLGLLGRIIGSPELHHWHHDRERDAGNYANVSPLMDILFGTHICPDHEPEHFGIKDAFSKTYIGQLLLKKPKEGA
jgi:sterol desaturase/sphingolipid hydroxylase (fatty acid hydroxylase superfamily)